MRCIYDEMIQTNVIVIIAIKQSTGKVPCLDHIVDNGDFDGFECLHFERCMFAVQHT